MTTPTQLVFSSTAANPFAAAPAPPAAAPIDLTGDQALTAWAYLAKIVGEGTPITPALLASIAEKVTAGVLMSARQLTGDGSAADRRRTLAAYFNLPA